MDWGQSWDKGYNMGTVNQSSKSINQVNQSHGMVWGQSWGQRLQHGQSK